MKKTWIGGIAAVAVLAGGVGVYALTSGQAEPEAPVAPTSSATGESTASATPEPTSSSTPTPTPTPAAGAYPDADDDAYLRLVHRDWPAGEAMPTDDELLTIGYDLCDSMGGMITGVEHVYPQWSQTTNFVLHVAAGYHLCSPVE